MSIDERLRLNIHTRLSELIGSDEADALMVHMFSVPWHDVATKDDLRVMLADLRTEMAELRTEMANLRTELHQNTVGQTRWLAGYVSALAAVMLAVAALLF